MPLVGFSCPDGVKVELESCLQQCRMADRCLTLPTLVSISTEREWSGITSTTMLLEGTMLTYLKLTQPYYVDPDSRAFMLQGTKHHKELEVVAKELGMASEIPMNIDRDIFDLLEWEDKELVMTDYKLWGSFRVAKALGIVETGKQPHPTEVYKSSGKWGKAGSPKMIPVFKQVPEKADNLEVEFQLNRYRLMLKEMCGLTISKMRLQVTVRDGRLYIAKDRGIYKNIYMIPVIFLPDVLVEDYFHYKDSCLHRALVDGWNMPCTPQESWEGRKCAEYCDVWGYCPKGKLVHSIGKEKE